MKNLFLEKGRHLGKIVTLEDINRMVTERRERNQVFVEKVTQEGFPPSNAPRAYVRAVKQYVEKGHGTLEEAVQA